MMVRGNGNVDIIGFYNNQVVSFVRNLKSIEGCQYQFADLDIPMNWCFYYGVEPSDGVVVLYKAVDGAFKSPRGFVYHPGTTIYAPDWDGGKEECGGGLHFSPSPRMAKEFFAEATRFVACPVALIDMATHANGYYPQKCKARAVCLPMWEVDIDGNRV